MWLSLGSPIAFGTRCQSEAMFCHGSYSIATLHRDPVISDPAALDAERVSFSVVAGTRDLCHRDDPNLSPPHRQHDRAHTQPPTLMGHGGCGMAIFSP
jgi:hypothetical protein